MNTKQLWSFNKIMPPLARLEWEEDFYSSPAVALRFTAGYL
jgi:hypothetical protein